LITHHAISAAARSLASSAVTFSPIPTTDQAGDPFGRKIREENPIVAQLHKEKPAASGRFLS